MAATPNKILGGVGRLMLERRGEKKWHSELLLLYVGQRVDGENQSSNGPFASVQNCLKEKKKEGEKGIMKW